MKRTIYDMFLVTACTTLLGAILPVRGQTEVLDLSYLLNRSKAAVSHTAIDIGPIGNAINHGKPNNWWSYIADMNEYPESR